MKDVSSALKAYVHAERQLDKGFGVPGANAQPGDWAAYYKRIGAPEDAKGYAPAMEGFAPPEGLPWQENLVPEMMEKFKERGLLPHQARGLLDDYAAVQQASYAKMQEQVAAKDAQLQEAIAEKYGDGYPAAQEQAKTAFRDLFGNRADEIADLRLADGTKLGNHPAYFDAFAKIGKNVQQHDIVGNKGGVPAMTKDSAQSALNQMEGEAMMDRNHPLMNKTHPQHNEMVDRRIRLLEIVGHDAATAAANANVEDL